MTNKFTAGPVRIDRSRRARTGKPAPGVVVRRRRCRCRLAVAYGGVAGSGGLVRHAVMPKPRTQWMFRRRIADGRLRLGRGAPPGDGVVKDHRPRCASPARGKASASERDQITRRLEIPTRGRRRQPFGKWRQARCQPRRGKGGPMQHRAHEQRMKQRAANGKPNRKTRRQLQGNFDAGAARSRCRKDRGRGRKGRASRGRACSTNRGAGAVFSGVVTLKPQRREDGLARPPAAVNPHRDRNDSRHGLQWRSKSTSAEK